MKRLYQDGFCRLLSGEDLVGRAREVEMYARRRLGTLIYPVLLGALVLSCAPTAPAGAATANDPADPVAAARPGPEPEVVPTPAEGPPPQVGRPGGAPPTGGGGAIGGAPRGVLLIEGNGIERKAWLGQQNEQCRRAGAPSGCLNIVYRSVGEGDYDPKDPTCTVNVTAPANSERRGGKPYVKAGTTVTAEVDCEGRVDTSTARPPSPSTRTSSRTTGASSSVRPSTNPSSAPSGTNR